MMTRRNVAMNAVLSITSSDVCVYVVATVHRDIGKETKHRGL